VNNFVSKFKESFSPLKILNFRIYLGGQAISLIGTWLQMTAQQWVVWDISGSELELGKVAMLGTLPILLLGPWAGVWADRLDRRKLLIGTQIGAMLLAFILAALVQTNIVQLWHIYILSTLLGIITAIDMPAQQAFLGDLSGNAQVRKAVNVNAMILQVSRMIGPALAGAMVKAFGPATSFWLNGLSFGAVIASLVAVRANQIRKNAEAHPIAEFIDGLRFVATQPRLQDLIGFVVLVTFFGFPVLTILPSVATTVFKGGPDTLGLLLASSGAGALVGTLFVVPIAQSLRKTGRVVAVATFWIGLWYIVFTTTTILPLAMSALFMVSVAAPVVMTMALGLIQFLSPQHMRARLLSFFLMVSFGMQPFASLLIGYTAEHLSVLAAIRLNGLMLLAGTVLILGLRPELRDWEVDSHHPTATAEIPKVEIKTPVIEH
jgi:MFS family permease